MKVIKVRNVNEAVHTGIRYLLDNGIVEPSRNGAVLVAPEPVTTVYSNPTQRVLFSPMRDANPFFHLMESLWMLAGRNDLTFPSMFNTRFKEYSDDGKIAHGAYGHRWREHFGYDQVQVIIKELKANPATRRCVLQMWDASPNEEYEDDFNGADDLHLAMSGGKDVPCNTHIYFDVRGGKLNMTVCCRSNDIIWGAYGANAVHMSVLQEFTASAVGVHVGVYRQISNNFHVYTDVYGLKKLSSLSADAFYTNYYNPYTDIDVDVELDAVKPYPLISTSAEAWLEDLDNFFANRSCPFPYKDDFFNHVARPMYLAWQQRKNKEGNGMEFINAVAAEDWKLACTEWIQRREKVA